MSRKKIAQVPAARTYSKNRSPGNNSLPADIVAKRYNILAAWLGIGNENETRKNIQPPRFVAVPANVIFHARPFRWFFIPVASAFNRKCT